MSIAPSKYMLIHEILCNYMIIYLILVDIYSMNTYK